MRINDRNLIKLARLLAEKFVKKAVGEVDPFKGRFEFIDFDDLADLEDSYKNFKQRQLRWEHQLHLSNFGGSDPRFYDVNIYRAPKPFTSYVLAVPGFSNPSSMFFPSSNLTEHVKMDDITTLKTFGGTEITFPPLLRIRQPKNANVYEVGFFVDPELIFGNSRPEYISAALNVLAESYIDVQNVINAFEVMRNYKEIREGTFQIPQKAFPSINFFLKYHYAFGYDAHLDHYLAIEAMVLNLFEMKLKELPQPVAEAGYKLSRFITNYYETLTRKYFTDYYPDLPPLIKLRLAFLMYSLRRAMPIDYVDSVVYEFWYDVIKDTHPLRIDRDLNVFDGRVSRAKMPIFLYWPGNWKHAVYHLVKNHVECAKKLIDFSVYILSPDIPHPWALERLEKLDPDEGKIIERFEKLVGKELPGLRAMHLYWKKRKPYEGDAQKRYKMLEDLIAVASISRQMPGEIDLSQATEIIHRVRFHANGIDNWLFNHRFDTFHPNIGYYGYNIADFENMADLVYRGELLRSSRFLSLGRPTYGMLYADTKILPEYLRSYVLDIQILEPRFENIKKFNSMILEAHTAKPELRWISRFRGRR
jgi:hypothetical protein